MNRNAGCITKSKTKLFQHGDVSLSKMPFKNANCKQCNKKGILLKRADHAQIN